MGNVFKSRLVLKQEKRFISVIGMNEGSAIIAALDERLSGDEEDEEDADFDRGIGLAEVETKLKLEKPSMYKVILLNDDYTPMEFVIEVLQTFFIMNREKATQIMLAVHTVGKATCGIFSMDVAETKSGQINQYAQECQHPLISIIEATD